MDEFYELRMSPADRLDFRAKDLERKKLFGAAAKERYNAAQAYEAQGDKRKAMYSFNRSAKDAHFAIYNLERHYQQPDKEVKIKEMLNLNFNANMRAGELYLKEGDIREAAYCFSYAACSAAKLGLASNFYVELARKAQELFSEGRTEPASEELRRMLSELVKGVQACPQSFSSVKKI